MSVLRAAFGDEFHQSLRAPLAGISAGSIVAALSAVPWATVGPVAASLITSVVGAVIGLRTQRQLSAIRVERERNKLEMERLELQAFRRKVRATKPEDLHPEEIGREIREHEAGRREHQGTEAPAGPASAPAAG